MSVGKEGNRKNEIESKPTSVGSSNEKAAKHRNRTAHGIPQGANANTRDIWVWPAGVALRNIIDSFIHSIAGLLLLLSSCCGGRCVIVLLVYVIHLLVE
jgi:hypothetical protein